MSTSPEITAEEVEPVYRERCYECYRPRNFCFCDAIPQIDNRTSVLILQHVKERFHAFNTARIVRKALRNSKLVVDQTAKLASMKLPLADDAGLLFPGPDSQLLTDVPAEQLPKQLVILDGTWHHAKTFMKQIPALGSLPQFRLAPETPSRYRLRREPTPFSLSTLEATIEALRVMEPATRGFDALLAAFDRMVESQLQHPRDSLRLRRPRRPTTPTNIPSVLLTSPGDVIIVYGESSFGQRGLKKQERQPVYWVAERLTTGETFTCAIRAQEPITQDFLKLMQLTSADFVDAVSLEDFATRWRSFASPADHIVAYNESTLRLLKSVEPDRRNSVSLKSVNIKTSATTLDAMLQELNVAEPAVKLRGRAGRRMANAVAYANYLRQLGRDAAAAGQRFS